MHYELLFSIQLDKWHCNNSSNNMENKPKCKKSNFEQTTVGLRLEQTGAVGMLQQPQ